MGGNTIVYTLEFEARMKVCSIGQHECQVPGLRMKLLRYTGSRLPETSAIGLRYLMFRKVTIVNNYRCNNYYNQLPTLMNVPHHPQS
jgi:hypothetical protein